MSTSLFFSSLRSPVASLRRASLLPGLLYKMAVGALLICCLGALSTVFAQDFEGRWNSNFGELRLHQIGSYVIGDYADRGVLAGKIQNGRLEGQFTNGSRAGSFQFTRAGNTLIGNWSWAGSASSGTWRASYSGKPGRALRNFSRDGSTYQTMANDRGHIDGVFSSPYGEIRLFSRDLLLVGDYARRGVIMGIWDGNSYIGWFTNGGRVGWFDFGFLSRTGSFRTGEWGWFRDNTGTPWQLQRQSRTAPTLVNFNPSSSRSDGSLARQDPTRPEFHSGSGPRRQVRYAMPKTGQLVDLEYEEIDGLAIFQGDIILGRHADLRAVSDDPHRCANGVCTRSQALTRRTGAAYLWPAGVVPYVISSDFTEDGVEEIEDGIELVTSVTDLIFTERRGQTDYVEFVTHDEVCRSSVGRQGDRQVIELQPACTVGNIAHEVLHAIGFWHEQSRPGRDDYIEVVTDNVDPDKLGNFDEHDRDGEGLGTYDYGSIMHYGRTAFSKDGCSGEDCITIKVLKTDENGTPFSIGQRRALSSSDVAGVMDLYDKLDCVYFQSSRLRVLDGGSGRPAGQRWTVTDNRSRLFTAPSRTEAERIIQVLKHYDGTQSCFVGRPQASLEYFLAAGSLPQGSLPNEDCLSFRRSALDVQKSGNRWRVVDTSRNSSMFSAPNSGEAYRIIDLIQQFGANRSCFVGRPNASFAYLRR